VGPGEVSDHSAFSLGTGRSPEACFLAGEAAGEMTYLQSTDGRLINVSDVHVGEQVEGAGGMILQVVEAEHIGPQQHLVVFMRTRDATFVATGTHRVMRRLVSGIEAVPANSLRLGHDVAIHNFVVQELIEVRRFEATVPVSRLTFSPDGEVKAYVPHGTILSRGHRARGFRRGR